MKNTILSGLGLLFSLSLFAQSMPMQLNVPNSLFAMQDCRPGNRISYTVSEVLPHCINVFGNNPGKMAVNMSDGKTPMDPGAAAFVFTTVKLFNVSGEDGQKIYSFGQACAEEGLDDANIMISYAGQTPSAEMPVGQSTGASLSVQGNQLMTVSSNETANGPTGEQTYLQVLANENNTATLSINQDSRQGQVFICIYSVATGDAMAMLHAKSNNLSFTAAEDVFVVPMISPNSFAGQRGTTILFEVGDPKRNGKVVAEEEGE